MRATVNALVFAFCAGLYCVPAQAEDIDIYAGVPSETDLPNVLLILDNSANWSAQIGRTCRLVDRPDYQPSNQERGSKMGIEKCALYNLVHQLPTKPDGGAMFNVGLMLFNESPASHSGGYPRIAFTPLTAQNKARLKSQVFALDVQADKGNNAAFAKTLYEAYLYFSADSPYRGASGTKYDPAAFAAGRYAPPGGGGCGRNFAIFIANGGPGEVTDNEARALLVAAGGNANPILYPNAYVKSSDQANWADEFARFMSGASIGGSSGRNIVTHAIAVTGASSDGIYPNFLRGIAHQGGGSFAEVADADTLTAALLEIFVQIQAVDSVFSSVSLPLAAHSQDTFTNQLFVGMFRPDPLAGPRWYGNLKQYAIAYDPITDSLSLVDRVGRPAISAATGFIEPTAISYWSTSSQFWLNQPSGTPPSESDAPDGEVVEKGGIAQRLRERFADSQSGRALYTCVGCSAGSLLSMSPFVPGHPALTSEMFGTDDPAERDALIAWVRGTDNAGDERGPGLPTTVRPSIHGDVLHSRPVVIDYGEPIGPVVFYGSNDGLLRAVGAARDGPFAGQELWGFVAPEFFGRLARLRENWPLVAYPTMPEGLAAQPRDYFFDGPVGVYRNSATGSTILYPTMRRGGRTIYAVDVSDPLQPRFLWKKTPQDLPVLGQTWSEPRVARIRGQSGPVLVLGAGYDASAEDADPRGATSAGNAVLVLDALTGQLLRQFSGTARSVAADVALLDSDNDGYVDRAYAVDLGANIYRIDFESATGAALSPTGWTMYRLAALDDGIGSRKFFFTPDLVVTRQFVALLLGSGDREKPLKAFSNDRFFLVKDTHLGKGPPSPTWSAIRADDLAAVGTEGPFDHGCQLRLSGTGEKVVTAATSIAGKTYFSTNRPTPATPGSCSANLGEARNYEFPLFCKPASSHTLIGGGLPPSPVAGLVRVPYASPHDGSPAARVVPFIVGGPNPKRSALEITRVNPVIPVRRSRAYWYLESDDR